MQGTRALRQTHKRHPAGAATEHCSGGVPPLFKTHLSLREEVEVT
jgi:hypothetical protein